MPTSIRWRPRWRAVVAAASRLSLPGALAPGRTTRRLSLKNPVHIVSYGENRFKGEEGQWTIHAEDCAMRKLQTLPKKKKLEKINMLIIRTSKSGVYGNSKPCLHCIGLLYCKLPEKGYILDKVYFTDGKDSIKQVRLVDLIDDDKPHVSMYYLNRGRLY
jgi:cytidine deaminase